MAFDANMIELDIEIELMYGGGVYESPLGSPLGYLFELDTPLELMSTGGVYDAGGGGARGYLKELNVEDSIELISSQAGVYPNSTFVKSGNIISLEAISRNPYPGDTMIAIDFDQEKRRAKSQKLINVL